MNTRQVNSAAGVIMAALTQNRTAAGIALALESAGLLMSPEAAADLASVSTDAVVLLDKAVGELKREHELSAELRRALGQSQEDVTGACLARWEEEQDNARLRLALKSAQRRALRRLPHEREGLIFRLEQENKQLHAFVEIANEAARVQREAWEGAQDELDRLRAQVSELLAERHTTNDALADITVAERSAAKLGALLAPDACPQNVIDGDAGGHFFKKGAFADSPTTCSYCGAKRPESGGAE